MSTLPKPARQLARDTARNLAASAWPSVVDESAVITAHFSTLLFLLAAAYLAGLRRGLRAGEGHQ